MLSIIIPTLHQWDYYEKVVKNISNVYKWEYELITIENKLVNEAWNYWVEQAKWDYILIINDDIVIPKWTIEAMIEELNSCSVSFPIFTKLDSPTIYYNNWDNIVWFCFMIKKQDIPRCFPIPSELKLWYGDNWIYEKLNKDIGIVEPPIHHRESKTLMDDARFEECKIIAKEDKRGWIQLSKQFYFK